MLPIISFIHKNAYYVYDANVNKLIKISKEIFSQVRMLELGKIGINDIQNDPSRYCGIRHLISKGFFHESDVKEIMNPWTGCYKEVLKSCITFLVLQTTQNCNFKCRYCHFADENGLTRKTNNASMTWETAKKAIDFWYAHSPAAPNICIGFYGGEPLLNFSLIKDAILYSQELFERHILSYSMTTNGSLLTKEIVDFIVQYRFHLRISFDGVEAVQNKHRVFAGSGKETFDVVFHNIKYIQNTYPEYFNRYVTFNAVAMPDESPKETYHQFLSWGVPEENIEVNMANLQGLNYFIFQDNQLNFSNIRTEWSRMQQTAEQKQNYAFYDRKKLPQTYHPNGPCLPGNKRLFVSVDGTLYPCEKISETNTSSQIGNVFDGFDNTAIEDILNIGKINEQACKQCWCMRYCMVCASQCLNTSSNGYSVQRKELACDSHRKKTLTFFKSYIDSLEAL